MNLWFFGASSISCRRWVRAILCTVSETVLPDRMARCSRWRCSRLGVSGMNSYPFMLAKCSTDGGGALVLSAHAAASGRMSHHMMNSSCAGEATLPRCRSAGLPRLFPFEKQPTHLPGQEVAGLHSAFMEKPLSAPSCAPDGNSVRALLAWSGTWSSAALS